jgi:GxxExxY protein
VDRSSSVKREDDPRNHTNQHERTTVAELVLKDEVYQIVGAALEVYWELGRGFLEPVYQEALEIEFGRRGLPYEAQKQLAIYYKDQPLQKKYVADFVCFGQILAELKASEGLTGREEAQLLNYMKAARMRVGLLFNFGSPVRLEWKRYII